MTTTSLSLTELLAGHPGTGDRPQGDPAGSSANVCASPRRDPLAPDPDHPRSLGSALTHTNITTIDYESLLGLSRRPPDSIEEPDRAARRHSPPHHSSSGRGAHLALSMPCFVGDGRGIRLAQYGSSNIGRMRPSIARAEEPLRQPDAGDRRGALQLLHAGQLLVRAAGSGGEGCCSQRFISDKYMGLIRKCLPLRPWLVCPICSARLRHHLRLLPQGRRAACRSRKPARAPLYLPYATALAPVRSRLHQQQRQAARDRVATACRPMEQSAPSHQHP